MKIPGGRLGMSLALDLGPVIGLLVLWALSGDESSRKSDVLAALLVVLPLVARRLAPTAVLVVVSAGAVLTAGETNAPWIEVLAVALASFTTAERAGDRTRSAVVIFATASAMTLGFLAQDPAPIATAFLPFAVLGPAWLVGDVVRGRREAAAHREEAAARAVREAEERLVAAAALERRRLARELHDVLAHTVSVMVIQAGAARQVLRTSPDSAEDSLRSVEATGREAMAELRAFLGAMDDGDTALGLAPQPGIDQLDALVARVRDAGLPTKLEIDGTPRPVPPGLDVTVYRIVQEALTNALRYARQAATLVHLSWESEQLRVEVLDDGPGPAETSEGSGHGLAGMRQRATLLGGRLEAGPRIGGGYAVRAWLPLERRSP